MKNSMLLPLLTLAGLMTLSPAHGAQIVDYRLNGALDPEFGGTFSGSFSYRVGSNVDPDWIDGGYGFRWVGWNLTVWDVRVTGGAFDGLTFTGTEGSSFTFYANVNYGSGGDWTTLQRLFFTSDAGDYLSVDFVANLAGPFTDPQRFAQDAPFAAGNLMPISTLAPVVGRAVMAAGDNGVAVTRAKVAAVPEFSSPWVALAGLLSPLLLPRRLRWANRAPH